MLAALVGRISLLFCKASFRDVPRRLEGVRPGLDAAASVNSAASKQGALLAYPQRGSFPLFRRLI
jgi:hypothetical protein